MIFFETEQVIIEWDEINKIIITIQRGLLSAENYRLAANKLIELAELKKAQKYIADSSQARFSPEDQKWIVEDWLPRAAKAGLRYNANILPRNIIAQMSVNSMSQISGDSWLEARFFANHEDALAWLLSI